MLIFPCTCRSSTFSTGSFSSSCSSSSSSVLDKLDSLSKKISSLGIEPCQSVEQRRGRPQEKGQEKEQEKEQEQEQVDQKEQEQEVKQLLLRKLSVYLAKHSYRGDNLM